VHDAQRPPARVDRHVRGVEAAGDLRRDVRRVLRRDRLAALAAALEDRAQVLSVDVLHRDEVLAVRARELVDPRDVGVAEEAGDLGLVDQHLDEVVVLGQVGQDALHRHQVSMAGGVEGLCPVDLGHASERDPVQQVVPAELLCPSHVRTLY
jgi:hypothetical protein